MAREILIERFFTALISGERQAARNVVDEVVQAGCSAEKVLSRLFWPTLEQIQTLHRNDQLSNLAHHFATRMMRQLVDQMQIRLAQSPRRGKKVLMVCGPDEPEELAAQMAADLLEADGYDVLFAGGGIANDELIAQLGEMQADALVVFSATPGNLPFLRLLIDHMHDIGICPNLQIIVGGGVFNRAEGLAEEIGADLWAKSPEDLVEQMNQNPAQRMQEEQRTVGRKRQRNAA